MDFQGFFNLLAVGNRHNSRKHRNCNPLFPNTIKEIVKVKKTKVLLFSYIFEKYPNSNLQQYKSFTIFQNEIIKILENKGRFLKSKEAYPSLDYEKFDFIINYIKTTNVRDIRLKKFKTNTIAIKLLILYGISLDKLSTLMVSNYDYKRRAIEISLNDKRQKIHLEIPFSLALEIEDYLENRKAEKTEKTETTEKKAKVVKSVKATTTTSKTTKTTTARKSQRGV